MISWVIVSYLVFAFLSAETGMVNQGILAPLGREPIVWYQEKRYWPFLLVLAYLWKSVGFSMVIYLSSIVGISKEYYEAARIDGAGKWKQIRFITLPLLKSTVITLLIMNIGSIFYSDFGLFYQVPNRAVRCDPDHRYICVQCADATGQYLAVLGGGLLPVHRGLRAGAGGQCNRAQIQQRERIILGGGEP